jgi:hypothetical protein
MKFFQSSLSLFLCFALTADAVPITALRSSHEDSTRALSVNFGLECVYYLIGCSHRKAEFKPGQHPRLIEQQNARNGVRFLYAAVKNGEIDLVLPKSSYQVCGVAIARPGSNFNNQGSWEYYMFSRSELKEKSISALTIG